MRSTVCTPQRQSGGGSFPRSSRDHANDAANALVVDDVLRVASPVLSLPPACSGGECSGDVDVDGNGDGDDDTGGVRSVATITSWLPLLSVVWPLPSPPPSPPPLPSPGALLRLSS